MNLSDLQAAHLVPRHLSPVSAWVEHIPFAFALVDLLRPSSIVELGVHMGDSYCAFCQAVAHFQIDARCAGIDTWRGDVQAGFTDDTDLAVLRRVHTPYEHFSRLVQSSFDDALPGFPDGSIDLLHVDGLHTYEAVRHDFEAWLPKLSRQSVVLLHDTQVKQDGFGVHRLWGEIRHTYPSFEFMHGYGLGVLAVGRQIAPRLAQFLDWAGAHPQVGRDYFAALGGRLLLARHALRIEEDLRPGSSTASLAERIAPLLGSADLKGRLDAVEAAARRVRRGTWRWLFRTS